MYRCSGRRFAVLFLRLHHCDAVAEIKGRQGVGDQAREVVDKTPPFAFAAKGGEG